MTRTDKIQARRARALEALKKDRDITQGNLNMLREQLGAFERNERSLPQPLAAVQKHIQILKRDLDRQTMEIRALERNPKEADNPTRKRGTYELSQYLSDMKTHER